MNRIPVISNVVLAIALVVLYILHFTPKPNGQVEYVDSEGVTSVMAGELSVAWVDIDSLLNNYDMYFDIRNDLEAKGRRMETEMNTKTRTFERKMMDFQDKVQKGLVTRSQAQQLQQELAQQEQELYMIRNDYQMQFAEEEQVSLRLIQHSISEFLEVYNNDKGYHIILSSTFGGPMLYGHPALDITADVLKGINEAYVTTKSKK
jgi:outer membrane protein